MSMSALAFGLALASPQAMDFNHPATPWVTLEYSGAGPGGSDSTRVVFSRRVTLDGTGKPVSQPAPIWVVRKETKQTWTMAPRAGQSSATIQWIDSRTCPQLSKVLDSLDGLPAAKPYPLKQISKPFIDPPPSHSGGWTLTRWGDAAGGEVGITIADTSGHVIWPWWRVAGEQLQSCWRNEQPTYP
jgi:hypothetical protein